MIQGLRTVIYPTPDLAQGKAFYAAVIGAQQPEQKLSQSAQQAKPVVDQHLQKIDGAHGQVIWITDEALTRTFPKYTFFAVRYRIYPVAVKLPEGMKASNLFAVAD